MRWLRINGSRPDAGWRGLLDTLCFDSGAPYWIVQEHADYLELKLDGARAVIEQIGLDILDGALGFSPTAVAVHEDKAAPYYLRREGSLG